jgi:protein-S-isoprenylcysteine O-methyltransferase Ste14
LNGIDRQRLLSALILAVMALFVASGLPQAARWRRPARLAAIAGFLIAVVLALAEIVVWRTRPGR